LINHVCVLLPDKIRHRSNQQGEKNPPLQWLYSHCFCMDLLHLPLRVVVTSQKLKLEMQDSNHHQLGTTPKHTLSIAKNKIKNQQYGLPVFRRILCMAKETHSSIQSNSSCIYTKPENLYATHSN